jgi:hypothetical protein
MEQILITSVELDLAMILSQMTHTFKVRDQLNALISILIQIIIEITEEIITIIKNPEDFKVINNFMDKDKITILKM